MRVVARKIRVLIVDDSAVMRSLLRSAISSDASLEVAGTAVDGERALAAVEDLRPDVTLLDVEMPVLDGLRTLRRLRANGWTTPVIMCSALTQRGARVTLEALAAGASDYIAKPAGHADIAAAIRALAANLVPKIHALTAGYPAQSDLPPEQPTLQPTVQSAFELHSAPPTVVAIGVSTGGPAALEVLLAGLPAEFPLPLLVAQHMPELFTGPLAERLNAHCALNVSEAVDGKPVSPGTVTIARGDWHLETLAATRSDWHGTVHLSQHAPENHCRPSVDVLFRSAAAAYGAGVVAVVLTGMGTDGLAGARTVRGMGGVVLAQDQATSAVWGMPGAVAREGLAHRVLPLGTIADELLRLGGRTCTAKNAAKMRAQMVL
jgi:two-component system, chemotaxis family, protein-glutamate methylesterase/glutaminase